MRSFLIVPIVAAASISGAAAASDYRTLITRSLNLQPTDDRHFSISEPWHAFNGHTMVCVRADIPDGSGGYAPPSDFLMYEIDNNRIVATVKEDTFFGCANRSYSPLGAP